MGKEDIAMAQFTVVFNNGGSYLVTAPDKYAAIEKAKEQNHNSATIGVKEVRDSRGNKV